MMINVNGRPVSTGASIDLLTRAVIISLFTWRRAGRDDAPRIFGWWGDTWPAVQNDRTGSRLYLLRRSKLTNKTPQLARDYVREALAWMVEDGVASRLDINAVRTGTDSLALAITIYQR
ncbi:phage GP46 family protein, partial [Shigella sonnei]|nr:phage GP46 family protein [Shigella sonnei]